MKLSRTTLEIKNLEYCEKTLKIDKSVFFGNYFYIVVKFHVHRSNNFGDMTKTRNVGGKLTKNGTIEKIVDVCACPDQYTLSPYFCDWINYYFIPFYCGITGYNKTY